MLEKTLGNTLVTKLRAILLMEADFNATNKIVYGSQMLNNAQEYKQIPGDLCKMLFASPSRHCVGGHIKLL
jgi:hypothetical protein